MANDLAQPVSLAPLQGAAVDGIDVVIAFRDGSPAAMRFATNRRPLQCSICLCGISSDEPALRFDGEHYCKHCCT